MEFKTVHILANAKEVKIVKGIISALEEKLPKMLVVTPFQFGKLGDNTMVTFKIEQSNHQMLIEKLSYNGIKVVTFDEKTKKYVEQAETQAKSGSGGSLMYGAPKPKPKQEEKKTLDQYIKGGEYTEVIKISRDIKLSQDEIEKAKLGIDTAISNAVQNTYQEGLTKKYETLNCIQKLMKIASDTTLKTLHKIEFLKTAGLYAIELCGSERDYYVDLISICNNNAMHSMVCIKAAIKFARLVLRDKDLYKNEISHAKKNLNVRLLDITYMNVERDITEVERELFNELLSTVRGKS